MYYKSVPGSSTFKQDILRRPIPLLVSWEQLFCLALLMATCYALYRLGDGFPPLAWKNVLSTLSGRGISTTFLLVLEAYLSLVSWLILLLLLFHCLRPARIPNRRVKQRYLFRWRWSTLIASQLFLCVSTAALMAFIEVVGQSNALDVFFWLLLRNLLAILILVRLLGEISVTLFILWEEWYLTLVKLFFS